MRRSNANRRAGDAAGAQALSSATTGRPANSAIPASAQPGAHFAVTDGTVTVGTVELIGDVYFAIGSDGTVIGTYGSLAAAVRAFPRSAS
jgi:hypothetical protein